MVLSARLQIKQTQSLLITPQLLQAIRLLQMSSVELDKFVASEIEQNPLLSTEDGSLSDGPDESPADTAELESDTDAEAVDLFPEQAGSDFGCGPSLGSGRIESLASGDEGDFSQTCSQPESLVSLLERRIEIAFANEPRDRVIALTLVCELDETGYLLVPLEEIATRLGASVDHIEAVLRRCQELAPAGIFARCLAECLESQLAERSRLDPAMKTCLANLPLIAERNWARLMALCGLDRPGIDRIVAEIRGLDPKPGLAFARDDTYLAAPDVLVTEAPGGGWRVELNDAALPRLLVDRRYFAEVSGKGREADRRYLSECLQKASWLEKSLDQRARTVLNVASEVVRRQEAFLQEGIACLRPLNLRMVADALGIHESTVSRAAANKTLATPRGIFEFRTFFSGALAATTGGEAHAAEAVKHRIRKLIGEESPDAILSDDALAEMLSRNGVEIARRTVAKYREMMGIGSSVERRRQKRLKAAS